MCKHKIIALNNIHLIIPRDKLSPINKRRNILNETK